MVSLGAGLLRMCLTCRGAGARAGRSVVRRSLGGGDIKHKLDQSVEIVLAVYHDSITIIVELFVLLPVWSAA